MNNPILKMLHWHLRLAIAELGKAGLLGLSLLLMAGWVYFAVVSSQQAELKQAQQQYDAALKQPIAQQKKNPHAEVADFFDSLPPSGQISQQVRQLHKLTEQHELAMGRVEYKLNKVAASQIVRYELRYSVVTDYPSLRHYIAEILSSMPNVALESLELRRFDDKAQVPQADLVLGIYFKDAS